MRTLLTEQETVIQNKESVTITKENPTIVLANAIKDNLNITNPRQIAQMIKRADKRIYSPTEMPNLNTDETWINGGQTREWYVTATVKPEKIIFFDNGQSVLPWIRVSVKDIKKLTKSPKTFATAFFNLVEQLKNNVSAATMAKQWAGFDKENEALHKQTYENRKKDAEKMITILQRVLKEKRTFIGQNATLIAKDRARLNSYESQLAEL